MAMRWQVERPYIDATWCKPRQYRVPRNPFLLIFMLVWCAFIFKHQIQLFQAYGWAAWREVAYEIFYMFTHPV